VLRRAKTLDKEDIKKALETADVMTIVGPVKFENYDGFLHQNKPFVMLSQWQKGKLFPIYPQKFQRQSIYIPCQTGPEMKSGG